MFQKPFPHYRETHVLDGIWDFKWLGDADPVSVKPNAVDCDECAPVPGVFDIGPKRLNARGTAVYRRKVRCPGGLNRLDIGGLGLYGRVFWDGALLGECTGPWTPCAFDFETDPGDHDLAIVVDNRFSEERPTLMHPFADFYAFGGIYRSVVLRALPAQRIERVAVTTLDVATGCVKLTIRTAGWDDGKATFAIGFDGGAAEPHELAVRNGVATVELNVPDFKVWTPDTPALHAVRVSCGDDAVVERFGIRTIATRGQEILLNGEPIKLCGVNRHESHPELGPVANPQIMFNDLMHVKALGANFVRCVHYAQDPGFLDLCDQVGVLVWEESLGWGNPESDARHPLLRRAAVEDTVAMVRRDVNHPSIVFWGFLNEAASDTQAMKTLYGEIASAIRAEDASRLVTFASNRGERDLCLEFADVIAVNLYPGWIDCDWSRECHAMVRPKIDALAAWASTGGREAKPLLVSEIGACGIYGMHDAGRAQWTEEFQADFFAEACRAVLENPRFAGIALWQFFDTRSFVNIGAVRTKPFGMNLAGLLDAYRRPKLAYEAVRSLFTEFFPLQSSRQMW
ncbi:MAG: glycoside hydrolase family 2 protein [Kiritimatiellia bacterium]|jgi:beta-glucuronidase